MWQESGKYFPHLRLAEKRKIFLKQNVDLPEVVCETLSTKENYNVQEIANQIEELGAEIRHGNDNIMQCVIATSNYAENQKTKKKPKRTGCRLSVSENEPLGIILEYDNGEIRTEVLTYNITGTVKIYTLKVGCWSKENLFALHFPRDGIVVIGEKSKVKKEYLMECFVRSGVAFKSSISSGVIAEVLFNYFSPRIEFAVDEWNYPTHPGWKAGKFWDANHPPCIKRREFVGLPLYDKRFKRVAPTNESFEQYFCHLSQIKNSCARVSVMMLPFYGILSSILSENKKLSPLAFVFTMLGEKKARRICELIQVFNREEISVNSLDVSDKELDVMIKCANDEVFLADAMYEEEDSPYYKKKVSDNALYLANVFLGKRSCRHREKVGGQAVLVAFSSRKIILNGCINILVSEEFWKKNEDREDLEEVVEAVMTAFVGFVETNLGEVKQIIRKKREQQDGRKKLLEVMQEILSKFFLSEGFAMLEYAKLSSDFKFEDILQDVVDTEELLENFRICVKRAISKFIVEHKGKKYGKHYVYFDSEWLYFPTQVFNRMLGLEGMLPYKEGILLELYEKNYLSKDMEGFSRKLMIAGERFETYQIKRDFFDAIGEVSIVDLGKVIEDEG